MLLLNWGCAFWLLMSCDEAVLHPEDFIHSSTHSLKKPYEALTYSVTRKSRLFGAGKTEFRFLLCLFLVT